ARRTLAHVLDTVLRLLHPVMPFVTEAMWRSLTGASGGGDSLMVAAWPDRDERLVDADAEARFDVLRGLVTEVNRFRSQNRIAPSARFELTLESDRRDLLEEEADLVTSLAGLSGLVFADTLRDAPGTSTIVFPAGRAQVALAGLIDVAAEVERLDRELDRVAQERTRIEGKLANESFVSRAPAEVVDRERTRLAELDRTAGELAQQRDALGAIDGSSTSD
ncbi:MAG: class I tRNA ligase family protein, partial [Nitriliruptoraceae bacterium]